jgi:hypothetical protein
VRSRKSLVKEADRVFSIHIRNRGATYGYNHCYTCPAYLPVEELQAGHFIPRRYFSTRWHELNVWPQCNDCNVELSGNLTKYENKLVAQYSALAVEALWDLARSTDVVSDEEIRDIINKYK